MIQRGGGSRGEEAQFIKGYSNLSFLVIVAKQFAGSSV
jgi:hypothetical protein